MTRAWWTPRRLADRARLVVAVMLHVAAERMADVACRIVPDWDGGE